MLANVPRARELALEAGLDALVCVLPINVYYLSDYESDWLFDLPWAACAILPVKEDLPGTLVVHDVELTNLAVKPTWMQELRVYQATIGGAHLPHYTVDQSAELEDDERRTVALMHQTAASASGGIVDGVICALKDLGFDRGAIGFDDLRFLNECECRLPKISGHDVPDLLVRIRMVKTDDEIALMREAARRNQRALAAAVKVAKPGTKWSDVRRAYHVAAAEQDCNPFCIYVGAGRRSMGLQADHDYLIEDGQQLCFDAMLTYRHYFGDVQRTYVVGEADNKLQRYWNAVASAGEECYSMMKPGVNTAAIRDRAISIVREAGIPGFRHAFVHGLGLEHLEVPKASSAFGTFDLEEGMVVNMDLEVCEIGFGGVYFEDTVRVGSAGPEYFYELPRELIRI